MPVRNQVSALLPAARLLTFFVTKHTMSQQVSEFPTRSLPALQATTIMVNIWKSNKSWKTAIPNSDTDDTSRFSLEHENSSANEIGIIVIEELVEGPEHPEDVADLSSTIDASTALRFPSISGGGSGWLFLFSRLADNLNTILLPLSPFKPPQ